MENTKRPTVLIVEDEKNLQEIYEWMLSERAECLLASSPEEMRQLVDRADVILLDYNVRGTTFDKLLQETKGKPTMVVSGVMKPVFDRQLSKPFTPLELMGQIGSLISAAPIYDAAMDSAIQPARFVRCSLRPELGPGKILRQIGELPYFEVVFRGGVTLNCHASYLSSVFESVAAASEATAA